MAVKVLILEDNPVARSFLCRVVRESFSDANLITEAGDLETARRHIAGTRGAGGASGSGSAPTSEPFKLILVDLELPDGNGMELLVELAGYSATKIVTTLYSDDDHLFPALQCGADGYLLKEDRFEVLVEELQKIVRGQPPLSPAIARRLLTRQFGRIHHHRRRLCHQPPGTDRKTARPRAPDPARDRGADLPEQRFHDQGDRKSDGHQVVHRQRPHQVDLQKAQRLQPRRSCRACEQAGAGLKRC
jgi:DNA-binding NarL/FixJ family response regulator